MKHFMLPRSGILRETHPESTQSPSPNPIRQRPPSLSSRKQKYSKENAPPSDPNSTQDAFPSPAGKSLAFPVKLKSPLPPRPPSSNPNNPLKRKLIMDNLLDCTKSNPVFLDSGVKVIVRMRPPLKDEEGDMIVQKVSGDSLSILGQPFTFDSVADTGASQLDIFELIGAPLVENCLAGFNSSVFAYGQTGSGKTYTMWGPANALLEENALNEQQGLTPRVLERLFARISEEQIMHIDTELKYQCRCSFLEIYNEQITDLLDPSQRNLQIREDVKSGVYVENLTEECICTMKGVAQILTKGLLNRRTSATSTNAESSRSHSVFTCVVESQCKSTADGLSTFKTSRINLVDLAGSERQKLTGAAGERLKEAGNINRSLSQLGNLINILAEVSQTGKQRHIPYRDSRLTFLLQESLGGNAKLAMVCAISPSQSCKSESFSTLRFAQRAKAIKNKAVVNEVMRNDVNFLREVICQLKDELIRMKSNCKNTSDANSNYSTGWNARKSLHVLKFSLSRPTTLPHVDNDSDEEMEIVEGKPETVQSDFKDRDRKDGIIRETSNEGTHVEDTINDSDINMEEATPEVPERLENTNVDSVMEENNDERMISSATLNVENGSPNLVSCEMSPVLKSPTLSVSPIVVNTSRECPKTSQKNENELGEEALSFGKSVKSAFSNSQCLQRGSVGPLAASLHHGLEIIGNYRQGSSPLRQSFRFPLNTPSFNPVSFIQKVEVGVQTIPQPSDEDDRMEFLCSKCKAPESQVEESNENSNMQLVPIDVSPSMKQVPKAVEKVLAGAIRREMALEEVCAKQISEIKLLDRLVQQYKYERECNAVIGQTREDKILRLENLMDGVLPPEDFMDEELASLTNEHKLLKEKYANHPEIMETKIELKRVQGECEQYRSFFDLGEKEVLLEEIQDLRSHLQFYIDSSSSSITAQKRRFDSKLGSPLSTVPESSSEEKVEEEESRWIYVAEGLRKEVEASRSLGEKLKRELDSEKKCSEELKEALQMAMMGHARMLEQYADLEEKHMELLARHRKVREGMNDVKKAAQKAGVKGAESKFINALASEISALKGEREKERRYLRDEIKGLQAQLRDTAEAVQAAGELLVRLKEAEESVAIAEKKAMDAEHETEKTHKQMRKLKRKHEKEISAFNDEEGHNNSSSWKEGFEEEALVDCREDGGDLSHLVVPPSSWYSGSDQCNI